MAANQNHQFNTDQIRELLSPYLDGEVTDEERALVEQAIAASDEIRGELETLRRTIALVAALPPAPEPMMRQSKWVGVFMSLIRSSEGFRSP